MFQVVYGLDYVLLNEERKHYTLRNGVNII